MSRCVMQIDSILQRVFPSAEMASCLTKHILSREKVRDAVAYAPIPLQQKQDLFLQLASEKNTAYFRRQAGRIEMAIREMRPNPGEFFYLKNHYYDEDDPFPGPRALEPYLTWEHVLERIQEYRGYLNPDERELNWFQVEKWSPDGTGRLKNTYDYTILGEEVCYFWQNVSAHRERVEFDTHQDLNLPVPFRAGDILIVDCRPFAPVRHVVLLEVGDNRDCCCLQAMFREEDSTWTTGAVKHGHTFPKYHSSEMSPLYRLASFHGQLSKEERLLEKVSQYINGDEGCGAALWNYISEFADKKRKKTRGRKWSVTEKQILSYLLSNSYP